MLLSLTHQRGTAPNINTAFTVVGSISNVCIQLGLVHAIGGDPRDIVLIRLRVSAVECHAREELKRAGQRVIGLDL